MAKCVKHRRKAVYKWRICSIDRWEGVCEQCDIELNEAALKWRYPKSWKKRLAAYKAKLVA